MMPGCQGICERRSCQVPINAVTVQVDSSFQFCTIASWVGSAPASHEYSAPVARQIKVRVVVKMGKNIVITPRRFMLVNEILESR
jgi:hypothetical protein